MTDFVVAPYEDEMTIAVGVSGSAGYTRTVKNVSDNPEIMKLQFYSAFGGINDSFELVLYKNEMTEEWESAK